MVTSFYQKKEEFKTKFKNCNITAECHYTVAKNENFGSLRFLILCEKPKSKSRSSENSNEEA